MSHETSYETSSALPCQYLSSRGLLQSTKTHMAVPKSSTRRIPLEFARRLGSRSGTIYLTPEMLPRFMRYHLWRIRAPFTLVTGDSDLAISETDLPPGILTNLLSNRFLKRWYAQNLDHQHPKLTRIPIGLDYHTIAPDPHQSTSHDWGERLSPLDQEAMLKKTHVEAGPLSDKTLKAFSNWHFTANRGNRQECLDRFPQECAYFQPKMLSRMESWALNAGYAFTISPLGNGLDCHRTWEAMALGSIPVVKTSPLDPLYEDLPVVILEDWADFTPARMQEEFEKAQTGLFDFNRLTLKYWQLVIEGQNPNLTSLFGSDLLTLEAFRQLIQKTAPPKSETGW